MDQPISVVGNGEAAGVAPSGAKAELDNWLAAAAVSQPGSSGTTVAQLHQNEQESKHSLRQFVLTIVLIGLYAIGNGALIVQWFRGQVEATIAVAAVGNIGVFVGAAVAYYFAGTSSK